MIPKVSDKFDNDPCSSRKYKSALYNTLIHLKPKTCLEIGAYMGGSAEVFQTYFNEYMPDGLLVSADIRIYREFNLPNVRQVKVHPHVGNSRDWHDVDENDILPYADDSVAKNELIILTERIKKGYFVTKYFDMALLDGDHQTQSMWRDFEICCDLTTVPHYILIDDTQEDGHGHNSVQEYQKLIQLEGIDHYDFDDWDNVGMGLVWKK